MADAAEQEQELIERALAGDINAFEAIYRAHSGMVYSVAYRIVNNAGDAEEVTQDVFMSMHQNLKNFRGNSSLKTWAYRITVNRSLNALRRAGRIRSREQLFDHDVNPDDLPNNIDQNIEASAAQEKAAELLNALDPEKRACLTLRAIDGLSYEEISAALGININTVRTRLKRAREFLLNREKTGARP
ncbi:MAG: RNA polymerase sigma factor [Candidatus Omnitrophota bacterium]